MRILNFRLYTNFFVSDFFDSSSDFNSVLSKERLDYIVGNPPWAASALGDVGKSYISSRRRKEKNFKKKFTIGINNNEIVEGFIFRVSDFCSESTKIALIVRSTILYNLGYNDGFSVFRQYLLQEFFIDRVFELAPVRFEVFDRSNDPSIAPAAILFYRYAKGLPTEENTVEHIALKASRFFSLFKIFTINRSDYKQIIQKQFIDNDWLWKAVVYGTYLDFNFISRLKENYPTVRGLLSDKDNYVLSTGFHSRKDDLAKPKDTSCLQGKTFIKATAVSPFHIDYCKVDQLISEKVDIVKDSRIYKAPVLLIRNGLDTSTLTAKAAIAYQDVIFKNSLSAVKILNEGLLGNLQIIMGLLQSKLYAYLAINTFCSIGIEREQTKEYEKLSIPFVSQSEIGILSENITGLSAKLFEVRQGVVVDNYAVNDIKEQIKLHTNKIESLIEDYLDISNSEEKALIDYAIEINLKLITGDIKSKAKLFAPLNYLSEDLNRYVSIFLERFKNLQTDSQELIAEIWYSKHLIGIVFKMSSRKEAHNKINWLDENKKSSEILDWLIKFAGEQITERLFIQKDIRGFEEDSFYIFKPNEMRLWHESHAYIDSTEFADAILLAGRAKDVQ